MYDYKAIMSQANAAYQQTIQGYQTALANQKAAQKGVMTGYNKLQKNVLGGLEKASAGRSQEIADFYAAASGKMQQDLINRGLANSTVLSSSQRGLNLDEAKAQTGLQAQMAEMAAQYQASLGLAGLNYRGQAIGQNTALQMGQLGYQGQYAADMNRIGLGFAGLEAQLMYGGGGGGGMRPSYGMGGYGGGGAQSPFNSYGSMPVYRSGGGGFGGGGGGGGAWYELNQPVDPWVGIPANWMDGGDGGTGGGSWSDWDEANWLSWE